MIHIYYDMYVFKFRSVDILEVYKETINYTLEIYAVSDSGASKESSYDLQKAHSF